MSASLTLARWICVLPSDDQNVVRLAIEPLQGASVTAKRVRLTARGLRGLPVIEADMQRLVQAIRNVVLNAVKFTPDGGRIDIIGTGFQYPDG